MRTERQNANEGDAGSLATCDTKLTDSFDCETNSTCHLQRPDRYEMGLDLLKRKFNSILRFNWMAAGHVTLRTLLIGRKLWRGGFHHQSRRQQCRVNTIHLKSSTDEQNPAETVRSGGEIFENAKTEVMNE